MMINSNQGNCKRQRLALRGGGRSIRPSAFIGGFAPRACRSCCSESTAALFLDVKAVYYRILRQAAYGLDLDADLDRHVCRILRAFDLNVEDGQQVLSLMQQGGTAAEHDASPHLRAILVDLHRESFFVTRHGGGRKVVGTTASPHKGHAFGPLVS